MRREKHDFRAWWAVGGLLALVLGIYSAHLSTYWRLDAQYSYGWLVPALAAFLVWHRWLEKPAAAARRRDGWLGLGLGIPGMLAAWWVAQPNPDWRLISWGLAAATVAALGGLLKRLGGWAWLGYFAFPVVFLLTAVPWPSNFETWLTSNLMNAVASTTVTLLNLVGVPAVQSGNLIQTRNGLLGIDEACSGIRSLQATLMISLFLGDYWRFSVLRRGALLGLGLGIAFLTNVGRALFLATQAAEGGRDASERWHDPAGLTVALVCFALVWAVAALLAKLPKTPAGAAYAPDAGWPSAPPWRGAITASGLLLVGLIAVEWWYQNPSGVEPPGQQWQFRWPPVAEGAVERPIPAAAAAMLQADEARSVSWNGAQGEQWLTYFFRWEGGGRDARLLASVHEPENCLPSAGWKLVERRKITPVARGGLVVPFEALRFEREAAVVYVWFCRWEDRPPGTPQPVQVGPPTRADRLAAVWRRERGLGQQVLQPILWNPTSSEEADAAFEREIAARLVLAKP